MSTATPRSAPLDRRVLLLNANKTNGRGSSRLHMGLLSLGTILAGRGHSVRIIDYSFLASLGEKVKPPSVADAIADFRPDVIGLSVFTFLYDEAQAILGDIHSCSQAPVIVGGPHATLFPEDFGKDPRVHYIVRGEAEGIIEELVRTASAQVRGQVIEAQLPAPSQIPRLSLDLALGAEFLTEYQIQLSRGCPYRCTFCTVEKLAGNRIRPRDISECLEELAEARRALPSLKRIAITDDCPTYDMARFKGFLKALVELDLGCDLWVDNMRANLLDDELLGLYKEAGGSNICIGVESGCPAIFESVDKSESLSDIIDAAELVHNHGIQLGLCFVIGLPGDNPAKHRESIRLAKRLKPDYIFWNMCVPWPDTAIHKWFQTHGTIRDYRNFSTLMSQRAEFQPPLCISPDFSGDERIAAWLSANLETHYYFTSLRDFPRLLSLAIKYRCLYSYFVYCFKYGWRPLLRTGMKLAMQSGKYILRRTGKKMIGVGHFAFKCVKYGWLFARSRLHFWRARKGLSNTARELNRFGVRIGLQMLRNDRSIALTYLLAPLEATRYFELPFLVDNIDSNGRDFLDVSSPRIAAMFLARKRPECRITVLNPDAEDLDMTRLLAKHLRLSALSTIPGGCERVPALRQKFDCIWSISVLEHIAGEYDDTQAVQWLFDALKPGGQLILTLPTDKTAWTEYRPQDSYGLQAPNANGEYFFQRFYDAEAIRRRITGPVRCEPEVIRWFGEEKQGRFHTHTKRIMEEGLIGHILDPIEMAGNYREYDTWEDMPGIGVCCLLLRKPEESI